MSRNSTSIANLQTALAMELTAVNQYMLHAHVLEDWGLDKLATKMRAEMQEELGHAQGFIQRMIFLKGDPKLEAAKVPKRAENLLAMFETDLADEENAIVFYTKAAQEAAEAGDIGTRTLFEKIVLDEEGHKAWLELQIDLVKRIGEANYTAIHMSIGEETA